MFNRPFDDQSNFRVFLESEAKLRIQECIRAGMYELVWSYILDYENEKNPFLERKNQIAKWKNYAKYDVGERYDIVEMAKTFNELGFKQFDSLHIASAISVGADYFLTTDSGILRKTTLIENIEIKDPIDFIKEVLS